MATLSYTQETMPKSSEEFQRDLAEAIARSNPIDDLLELAAELRKFEEKYGMASDEFYRRFKAGELGDDFDFFDWSSCFRMYSKTRRAIESALGSLIFRYDNAAHYPDLPTFPAHKHTPEGVIAADAPDLAAVLREIDAILYPTNPPPSL